MSAQPVSLEKFLKRDQVVGPFIVNFIINVGIPWAAFGHHATAPLWGPQSVAGDMLLTMFLLPFGLCLVTTPLICKGARDGKLPQVGTTAPIAPWVLRLPDTLLVRSLLVGLVSALLFGPPIALVLSLLGRPELPVLPFVLGKGFLCGALAAAISPPLALRALLDVQIPSGTPTPGGSPQNQPTA